MKDALAFLILPAFLACMFGLAAVSAYQRGKGRYGVDDGDLPPRGRNRMLQRSGGCLARQRTWGNHEWQ